MVGICSDSPEIDRNTLRREGDGLRRPESLTRQTGPSVVELTLEAEQM